jgi:cytochrome c-type biogenesis protein CcmH
MQLLRACAIYITILFFLAVTAAGTAFAEDQYPFASATRAKRFYALTQRIRCLVCQGQSIAESNAPLAADLREKVYHMVVANKSDAEIRRFIVQRYGEWALLQPQFNGATAFLWLFPGLCLIVTLVIFTARRPLS